MKVDDNRIAALANMAAYDPNASKNYIDGAAHIKHASLRVLYAGLVVKVFDNARKHAATPTVLDLGAGEGAVTLPFLELGAKVTAVDISASQLEILQSRCEQFADRLTVRHQDIAETLQTNGQYDIVVANSFLHHIPDYLEMLRSATKLISDSGQFFSFQDPMRYDTVGSATRAFSILAYAAWRVFRGDAWGALTRQIRRSRGIYLADSVFDNAEYHVTRNGVDQDAISDLFKKEGFDCQILRYFSTQSRLFQPIGTMFGVENTFAVVARRRSPSSS